MERVLRPIESAAFSVLDAEWGIRGCHLRISLLEGEMPGRAEGVATASSHHDLS